jgi:hypothetical protein
MWHLDPRIEGNGMKYEQTLDVKFIWKLMFYDWVQLQQMGNIINLMVVVGMLKMNYMIKAY